jgi:hypothetical protein
VPILTVVLVLVAVGVLLWLATTLIPMDPTIRKVTIAVVAIALVVWLLKVAGLWQQLGAVRV